MRHASPGGSKSQETGSLTVCCLTHEARDRLDLNAGLKVPYSTDARLRCQCGYGEPCKREMTQEDFLCDWCRGTDHMKWCYDNPAAAGGYDGPPNTWLRMKRAERIQAERIRQQTEAGFDWWRLPPRSIPRRLSPPEPEP